MSFCRRNLPHWHPEGAPLFITWRLRGSLPAFLPLPRQTAGRAFRALDTASAGPVWLKQPRIAALVAATLRCGDEELQLYRLGAFVVMPNHVHVLLEAFGAVPRITQLIKGNTARQANQVLGRAGAPFWQHESYDHWVRSEAEYRQIVRYIECNPVAAGLAGGVEEWPWSSAYAGPIPDAS